MADPIIRQMGIFWNNKKATECNHSKVSFMMEGVALYGQEGIIAYSDGRAKMRVTLTEVTPIDGSFSTKDVETMILKKKMPIGFILGGRFFRSTMTVITADYDSDSEKNVTTGEIVLESKAPTII